MHLYEHILFWNFVHFFCRAIVVLPVSALSIIIVARFFGLRFLRQFWLEFSTVLTLFLVVSYGPPMQSGDPFKDEYRNVNERAEIPFEQKKYAEHDFGVGGMVFIYDDDYSRNEFNKIAYAQTTDGNAVPLDDGDTEDESPFYSIRSSQLLY